MLIGLQQGQQALLQQSVAMAYRLQRDPGHWLDQVADYLCEQQHSDLALPLYQQAAKLGLEGPELEHKIAALRGDMPDRAPDRYVEQLYQTHAAQFERRLLGKLGYRAPWQLTEQLQQLGYKRFDKVLDLGCGQRLGRPATFAKPLTSSTSQGSIWPQRCWTWPGPRRAMTN